MGNIKAEDDALGEERHESAKLWTPPPNPLPSLPRNLERR
jgi:hypothetical protein